MEGQPIGRIRRPKGQRKTGCSMEGCDKQLDNKKDRYCPECRRNYMRAYMKELREQLKLKTHSNDI